MIKLAVITGSTRPNRFGPKPAQWIFDLAKTHPDIEVELIDVKELNLPFLDEPTPPSSGEYTQAHTKEWSEKVKAVDGFIFVTAEYNHTIPAALKNAIDFLWLEWNYKPAAFVSYGAEAGGARAVEHLRNVSGQLKLYDLRSHILIPNYWTQMDEAGTFTATEAQIKAAHELVEETAFWAETMKQAREKRAAKTA
ncbi:MAG TPA: NAD(P)H-dependent oxidoreductase [Candidatus Saccharimonadales bacterium]|jgi:NAD(P)H-dependent FMN reductase|nr:NAD(P)H-dependent oxidoreductase [Candidatus Saccharimonadales bacterium]